MNSWWFVWGSIDVWGDFGKILRATVCMVFLEGLFSCYTHMSIMEGETPFSDERRFFCVFFVLV